MNTVFSVALNLTPLELIITFIAGFGFIILFGLSSAKGGYKDLIDTTLRNDQNRRLANKKKY